MKKGLIGLRPNKIGLEASGTGRDHMEKGGTKAFDRALTKTDRFGF